MGAQWTWSGPPIEIVGMGVDLGDTLGPAARAAIAEAEVVIGDQRHLDAVANRALTTAELHPFPNPFDRVGELLQDSAGRRVAVLASGDPLLFGVAATFVRRLGAAQCVVHPNVSSIQAAFARVGRAWHDAELVSLHGRPLAALRARLRTGRCYAVLTDRHSTPSAVAALLVAEGLGDSTLWVAEELGTAQERCRRFVAAKLAAEPGEFASRNVLILETRGTGTRLPEFPGIPDHDFETGAPPGQGMLSKREVRINILSLLAPRAGEVGWDVGAGCGGTAVEWARWNPHGHVHAVEVDPERVGYLQTNRERFGVAANLHVHPGRAPEALSDLPDPDAVFVGGSDGNLQEILDEAWARLYSGGRLVASAVTEETRAGLLGFASELPAQWTEIAVARGEPLGSQTVLRPLLPVLLLRVEKCAG